MPTIREQILRAALEALNSDDRPDGVPVAERTRVMSVTDATLPAMIIYPVKEETVRQGQMTRRAFVLRVECLADSSPDSAEPIDALVDDMLAWCTKALSGSKFGGLAQDTQEIGAAWEIEARDYAYARVAMDFGVHYFTPMRDQSAR